MKKKNYEGKQYKRNTKNPCTFSIISTLSVLVKTHHTDSCSKFFSVNSTTSFLYRIVLFFLCDFMSRVKKATSYGRILSRLIHSLWIIAESTALLTLCLYSCVMVTETFVSYYQPVCKHVVICLCSPLLLKTKLSAIYTSDEGI